MTRFACLALVLSSASLAYADGPKLHPGKWSFATTVTMGGQVMPIPANPDQCITPEQAKDPMKQVKFPPGCETSKIDFQGNVARWTLACHMHGGTQTGSGSVTFTADTMLTEGTISMEIPNHGTQTMTLKVDGKRLGDCAK